ncbi:MAG: sugar ABC transporter ATP-binding protein [Pseudonocardiales bacterium]|nr:sugar ABC transporter ATP-binding protein [Pseudonocardiales bacterium]MBV9028738.1 sugar ABC transporter ATP-binding protein [Pseudonocardiales bacterium]MBW0010035.1 sugar ABC transporter ATP-binding protein [Pseudonocardiales bacterium]
MGPVLTRASPAEPIPPEGTDAAPALVARALSKRFAGRTVLHRLDLDLHRGEVRGLLGHNGSGKSTFVKILSGYHQPEPGAALTVCGQPVAFTRSGHDPAHGLMSFVHQDLGLVATATIVETFGVGRYLTGLGGRISWRRERSQLAAALARFGVDLPPDRTIAEIPVTDRAILAIARAFDRLADRRQGVLVLDEPTAFLPQDGVERVCAAIRTVAHHGVGVLLVTHNIPQALAITERITVLRDGHRVLEEPTTALTTQRLVTAMVTEPVGAQTTSRARRPRSREVALAVRDLGGAGTRGVSFDVRAGEIVGLTGLMGSGFQRVPYLLFGATAARSGSACVHGDPLPLPRLTPARAIRAGLCLVPGDRARHAAVLDAPAADNITLGDLARHVRRGLLRQDRVVAHASALMDQAGVQPLAPGRDLRTFSGGNQQKAVLAKWLARAPRVLLLDEPVHGVDVSSRAQIFTRLAALADAGTAIVLASIDHDDLVAVCDTVLVLANGRITARLHGETLTAQRMLTACYQHTRTPDETV